MKKAKKQKLNNIWSKLKKPLMVFSIVGNILFLIFIIVGCVGTHKKATQTSAESLVTDLTNTEWLLNASLGETMPGGHYFNASNDESEWYYINFISNDTSYTLMTFNDRDAIDVSPANSYLEYNTTGVWNYPSTWVNEVYRDIQITSGTDVTNISLISWLESNATLIPSDTDTEDVLEQRFTFDKSFNYNAPYKQNVNSMFVNQYWEDVTTVGIEKVYDLPLFVSNGEYFNRIRLWFWNGNGTRYRKNETTTAINSNTSTAYYGFMQYINTTTNLTREVNARSFSTGAESNLSDASVQTFLEIGSFWLNDNYRYLGFFTTLTSEQLNSIAQFNSAFDENGLSDATTNVGLGNVFTLLSSAFGSFTNIFKIEILPNITIGLLLFLPLIVIVIIVIIKLVKR